MNQKLSHSSLHQCIIKFVPTSDEGADPNDVRGLFQALTDGGCGGLMGPTEEKKSQEK